MGTLSINSFELPNYRRGGTTAALRIWFAPEFVTAEGEVIIGGAPKTPSFYKSVPCTVDPDTLIVTVEDFSLPTTDDSSFRNARATGALYDSGGTFAAYVFINFIIPTVLSPSVDFAGLNAFNAASRNPPPPPGSPTAAQVVQLIRSFGNLSGTLTANQLPRANGENTLTDSQVTDNGTDVLIQLLNYFQAGDWQVLQNGTFISVNDSFSENGGRASVYAGGDGGNEYAGVSADCSNGVGEVFVQSTGLTHLHGANQVTKLGDALDEANGTKIVVKDPTRMVVMTAANQVANDPDINNEQFSPYLSEAGFKLMLRVRLSDGSYRTGEVTLYDGSALIEINEADGTVTIGDVAGSEGETTLMVDDLNGVVNVEASNGVFINGEEVFTLAEVPEIPAVPTAQDLADVLVALGLATQA